MWKVKSKNRVEVWFDSICLFVLGFQKGQFMAALLLYAKYVKALNHLQIKGTLYSYHVNLSIEFCARPSLKVPDRIIISEIFEINNDREFKYILFFYLYINTKWKQIVQKTS